MVKCTCGRIFKNLEDLKHHKSVMRGYIILLEGCNPKSEWENKTANQCNPDLTDYKTSVAVNKEFNRRISKMKKT